MSRQQSAPVPGEVSEALKLARKYRAMSMERAAQVAGISTSLWTQIENGTQYKGRQRVQASTTAETLQSMAEAVGLDPVTLLAQAGLDARNPTGMPVPHINDIVDLSGLSENELHNVAGYIAGLKARRRM
jgi:transcriptional regulator with XRE-family HTH domain